MRGRPLKGCLLACPVIAALAFALPAAAQPAEPTPAAGDGPGALSHFDLARKDCVGTARNRRSKVWFTVADGVLSDVYFPTNDNTNNETLQYVVTDGAHVHRPADARHDLHGPGARRACADLPRSPRRPRAAATGSSPTTSPIPHRPTVLHALPLRAARRARHARLPALRPLRPERSTATAAAAPGNGGAGQRSTIARGGRAHAPGRLRSRSPTTNAANRDYARAGVQRARRLAAVPGGLERLRGRGAATASPSSTPTARLTATLRGAPRTGNLVQTGPRRPRARRLLHSSRSASGRTAAGAVDTARRSARASRFDGCIERDYARGWHAYDDEPDEAARGPRGVSAATLERAASTTYYLSANYVKAAEDKTFPGAIVAPRSPRPWGQAVVGRRPRQHLLRLVPRGVRARPLRGVDRRSCWPATGAPRADMTRFLFERQQLPDGSMPRNSLTNGKLAPDSFGTQLDECAYPLIMALARRAHRRRLLRGPHQAGRQLRRSADGPAFGPGALGGAERLLALHDRGRDRRAARRGARSPTATATGVSAAHLARRRPTSSSAASRTGRVTTNGPLSTRARTSSGSPRPATRTRRSRYNLGNGGPTLDQREVIDAGFLELRAARRAADATTPDRAALAARRRRDDQARHRQRTRASCATTATATATAPADGRPWAPHGVRATATCGRCWPGERGQHELDTRRPRRRRVRAARGDARHGVRRGADPGAGVGAARPARARRSARDPTIASIGFENGKPAGSASALTWSAAAVRAADARHRAPASGARPAGATRCDRYVKRTAAARRALTVTAPADNSAVDGLA